MCPWGQVRRVGLRKWDKEGRNAPHLSRFNYHDGNSPVDKLMSRGRQSEWEVVLTWGEVLRVCELSSSLSKLGEVKKCVGRQEQPPRQSMQEETR